MVGVRVRALVCVRKQILVNSLPTLSPVDKRPNAFMAASVCRDGVKVLS